MLISYESDEMLHKITGSIFIGYAVLTAHKIGLFHLLEKESLPIEEIAQRLNIELRPAQAVLSAAGAFNLVSCNHGYYTLSSIGRLYLSQNSPSYFGDVFDLYNDQSDQFTLKAIEMAVKTNKPQVYLGEHLFESNKKEEHGRSFTNSMHRKSYNSAHSWPQYLKTTEQDVLIDIGCGSGVHAISVCQAHPIKAILCDFKEILIYALENLKKNKLEDRIIGYPINMWEDPFPEGSIHFYSDIFHDWNPEKCLFLAKKSYESLKKGGRIILNEMLFNDDKTGPELTAAYNIKMLYWTEGQQFSKLEIVELLKTAGFGEIEVVNYFGNWSLIIGAKCS
ncbi:methyltransferase [Parachlamydia acanthamoebae]|uniref:methyltransferase n=1 Tax=Parachlamydia acanthamoebae TaxID=83552 RepID=UPI0007511E40|nr:methyltransferase [Parachlamydia acanthamoebae]